MILNDGDPIQHWDCNIDYIQITGDGTASVNFTVSLGGLQKHHLVDTKVVRQGNDYYIGDGLVNILGFETSNRGTKGVLTFQYGHNLGPFCTKLFDSIPMHAHNAFNADVVPYTDPLSGRGVGKWRVAKKTSSSKSNNVKSYNNNK